MLQLPLAQGELDRSAHIRGDSAKLLELEKTGCFYLYSDGQWAAGESGLREFSLHQIESIKDRSELYFLGVDSLARAHFLLNCPPGKSEEVDLGHFSFSKLRDIAAQLSPLHLGVALHGQGLSLWHENHQRCSRCGDETTPIQAGAVRSCPDGHHHYPRTDPAVIVLIKDRADRILLGHHESWPANRFSTFAGFVEPGESFEAAVVREVAEESALLVEHLEYLGSQPWPFPASIMIAYQVIAPDPENAKPDGEEITELRWFTRDELRSASESGELLLPPPISVARAMINHWYGPRHSEELTGKDAWRN
jgi:NAD+ diphosphatase